MAMRRTRPAEIFDLGPLGPDLKNARTTAIVKSKAFEAVRLIVHAGVDIKTHSVEGPITLHCLEGRAQLSLPDKVVELSGGQWLYLEGGVPHAIKGIEDTSLLLTILFSHTVNVQDRAAGEAGAKRNQVTDGSLSSTEKLNSRQAGPVTSNNATIASCFGLGLAPRYLTRLESLSGSASASVCSNAYQTACRATHVRPHQATRYRWPRLLCCRGFAPVNGATSGMR